MRRFRFSVLLCSLAFSARSQFTVDGYLVDGITNKSLSNKKIILFKEGPGADVMGSSGSYREPVISDEKGRFAFPDVPTGNYFLQVALPDEVYTYTVPGDSVYRHRIGVGMPSGDAHVVFRVIPFATLQGTIRDEKGEILPGNGVALYRRYRRNGVIQLSSFAFAGSYVLGQFTIGDLLPGDYVVCAEPSGWKPELLVPVDSNEANYSMSFFPRLIP